jgi:hypothetical protein
VIGATASGNGGRKSDLAFFKPQLVQNHQIAFPVLNANRQVVP